jgi:RNA polymerase sigma-70 factor, ECF subfamily
MLTWVYSFAINMALVAARRQGWKSVPFDQVMESPHLDEWTAEGGRAPADPQRLARAILFEGVPLDEIARHWGSNRNAVYKLLHDARRKLKADLEERGFGVQETLDLFGVGR